MCIKKGFDVYTNKKKTYIYIYVYKKAHSGDPKIAKELQPMDPPPSRHGFLGTWAATVQSPSGIVAKLVFLYGDNPQKI